MKTKLRSGGKTRSAAGAMAISAAVSMGITIAAASIVAYGLHKEQITWEQAGYWIMGLLFAASFAGAKSAYAATKRQRLTVSGMAGMLYWGLLLCLTALFFGGDYEAVWVTAGIICAGSGTSVLLSKPDPGKKSIKKRRVYR